VGVGVGYFSQFQSRDVKFVCLCFERLVVDGCRDWTVLGDFAEMNFRILQMKQMKSRKTQLPNNSQDKPWMNMCKSFKKRQECNFRAVTKLEHRDDFMQMLMAYSRIPFVNAFWKKTHERLTLHLVKPASGSHLSLQGSLHLQLQLHGSMIWHLLPTRARCVTFCGSEKRHDWKIYPAHSVVCYKCHKKGHCAKVCKGLP